MNRIVMWDDSTAPVMQLEDDGNILMFYDYPNVWGFEVGNRIHYSSRISPDPIGIFQIVEVTPVNNPDFPKELQKVVARKIK